MDLAINLDPAAAGSVNYGDLLRVNGDFVLTADAANGVTNPILQDIQIRLRTFLGEWFMDSTLGLPWRTLPQATSLGHGQLDAVIQNAICTTPGVLQLNDYESSLDTAKRLLSIRFVAATTRGPINYTTQVAQSGAVEATTT